MSDTYTLPELYDINGSRLKINDIIALTVDHKQRYYKIVYPEQYHFDAMKLCTTYYSERDAYACDAPILPVYSYQLNTNRVLTIAYGKYNTTEAIKDAGLHIISTTELMFNLLQQPEDND
jgi:hypothetical protein